MKDFKGKVIVVTGGASGIGFAFCKRFVKEGAKVILSRTLIIVLPLKKQRKLALSLLLQMLAKKRI